MKKYNPSVKVISLLLAPLGAGFLILACFFSQKFLWKASVLNPSSQQEHLSKQGPSSKQKRFVAAHDLSYGNTLRHTEKLSSPINVKIQKVKGEDFVPGQPFKLVGYIHLRQNAPAIDFKWHIPKEVQIVEGAQIGSIPKATKGKIYDIHLTIQTESQKNKQIHLRAGITIGKSRFSKSAIYNTVSQRQIKENMKALFERTKAFSKQLRATDTWRREEADQETKQEAEEETEQETRIDQETE